MEGPAEHAPPRNKLWGYNVHPPVLTHLSTHQKGPGSRGSARATWCHGRGRWEPRAFLWRLAATSLHRPLHALHPRLQKPLWLEWESRLCCSGEGRLWIPRLACLISPSSSHSIRYWPKAPAPVQREALGATSPISAARRKPSARNLGAGTPEPITLQPLATDHGHCPAHLHVPMAQVGSLVCKNENIF